jgi:thiamine pyrophosphate-dependent acetolactate synthase large subunit-like protein
MLNSKYWRIMLVKQVLIDFFEKMTLGHIFYLPGIHTISLNEALRSSKMGGLMGRHESNIAFMADGYARATGKIGVVLVTPGPGLGNVVSGCMEAYGSDVPILIIHIDTGRKEIGKGILHELVNPENIFREFTKKTFYVASAGSFASTLHESYQMAMSERTGPVLVSIPYALLDREVPDTPDNAGHSGEKEQTLPHTFRGDLEEALNGKKRPVIVAGKFLMIEGARPVLEKICMGSSIPFFTTTSGKGIVDERSLFAFGNIMRKGITRDIVTESDLVIAIGTRLRDIDTKRRGVKIRELIHIDIDTRWFGKNYAAKLAVAGDVEKALDGLSRVLAGKRFEWDLKGLKDAQTRELAGLKHGSPGFHIVELIRDAVPDNTIMVCDLNLPSYWAQYYFPVYEQNTFIMPRGVAPIFYALPASIGAKVGRPERPCLSVCGDGGLLPAVGEFATIRKYNIPVVILLHNNNSFGILEDAVRDRYGTEGTMALSNPDFVKLVHAFGIKSKKTTTLDGLRRILHRDISWDEPFLIELNCPTFPPPWRASLDSLS